MVCATICCYCPFEVCVVCGWVMWFSDCLWHCDNGVYLVACLAFDGDV